MDYRLDPFVRTNVFGSEQGPRITACRPSSPITAPEHLGFMSEFSVAPTRTLYPVVPVARDGAERRHTASCDGSSLRNPNFQITTSSKGFHCQPCSHPNQRGRSSTTAGTPQKCSYHGAGILSSALPSISPQVSAFLGCTCGTRRRRAIERAPVARAAAELHAQARTTVTATVGAGATTNTAVLRRRRRDKVVWVARAAAAQQEATPVGGRRCTADVCTEAQRTNARDPYFPDAAGPLTGRWEEGCPVCQQLQD